MKTILIVEDEANIREVIRSYLQNEGFQTIDVETGREAFQCVQNRQVDFVILDLMLPDMEGEQVCEAIRQVHSVPILMLTAKVSQNNRIRGLAAGADDYVLKPFDPREVVARIRTILRRSNDDMLLADRLSFNQGELMIDSLKQQVIRAGHLVILTPNEYKILLLLAKYPQRCFSRDELIERVLGHDFEGDVRTIDQHVKNLRYKIESDPKNPIYLVTVYGFGYRFAGGKP